MSSGVRPSMTARKLGRILYQPMNPNPRDAAEARALAELVLLETGNDNDRAPDPIAVAEALGVDVYEVPPARIDPVRGLTSWSRGGYSIEISNDLGEQDRQAVTAHELGHVCCRMWNVIPFEWERFAWLFAGALLVRADVAADLWRAQEDIPAVVAALPHVPATAVALALGEHGVANVAVTQWRGIRYTRARDTMPVETVAAGVAAARSGRPSRRAGVRAWRLDDMPGRAAVVAS